MPTPLDIFRSAAVLIEYHGAGARTEAALRADAMMDKGNVEAHAFWLAVGRAITEIEKTIPDGPTH